MLAAYQLLPLLEGAHGSGAAKESPAASARPSCRRVVLSYWRKRALRLLPAYAALNLIILAGGLGPSADLSPEAMAARYFSHRSCPRGLWWNLAFLTNMGIEDGCGVHLWSLSVQVQFYLAFPLLLCALRPRAPGFRTRMAAALAATVVTGTAWRVWRAATEPELHLPLGDIAVAAEGEAYAALLSAAYFPTGPRVAELAMGVLLGLLLRTHSAVSWLHRRRALLGGGALCLQAAYVHLLLHWSPNGVPGEALWQSTTTTLYAALLYYGSPFVAALVSTTLLCLMLHSDPLHSAVAALLGAPALQPLSNLSYSLYLVHELTRLWGILYILPAGMLPALFASSPVYGLVMFSAFTLACGYAGASAMHHLVERRF